MASDEPARVRINFYKPQVADMSFEKIQKMIEKSSAVGRETEEDVVQEVVRKLKVKGVPVSSVTTAEALADAILELEPVKESKPNVYLAWFRGWVSDNKTTTALIAVAVLATLACLYSGTTSADLVDFVGEGMEILSLLSEAVPEAVMGWLKSLPTLLVDGASNASAVLQELVGVMVSVIQENMSSSSSTCKPESVAYSYFLVALNAVSVVITAFGAGVVLADFKLVKVQISMFSKWLAKQIESTKQCVTKSMKSLNLGFTMENALEFLKMLHHEGD